MRVLLALVMFSFLTLWDSQQANTQTPPEMSRAPKEDVFMDPRDGTVYGIVQLGSQLWLGENVRFKAEGSWAYDGDSANAEVYGRLYDWEGANCACPPGWRLPTAADWMVLFDHFGGLNVAGGNLKEAGTLHWREPNSGASDISRFSALPGGGRRNTGGTFHGLGLFGAFWTGTERGDEDAWAFYLGYHYPEVSMRESSSKGFGYSVRCLRE